MKDENNISGGFWRKLKKSLFGRRLTRGVRTRAPLPDCVNGELVRYGYFDGIRMGGVKLENSAPLNMPEQAHVVAYIVDTDDAEARKKIAEAPVRFIADAISQGKLRNCEGDYRRRAVPVKRGENGCVFIDWDRAGSKRTLLTAFLSGPTGGARR